MSVCICKVGAAPASYIRASAVMSYASSAYIEWGIYPIIAKLVG